MDKQCKFRIGERVVLKRSPERGGVVKERMSDPTGKRYRCSWDDQVTSQAWIEEDDLGSPSDFEKSQATIDVRNTRRLKILRVNPECIVRMLNGQHVEFTMLPVTEDIPEGTRVLSMRENWEHRTIDLMLTHESFPEVPAGEVPPCIRDGIIYEVFRRVPSPFVTAEEFREFMALKESHEAAIRALENLLVNSATPSVVWADATSENVRQQIQEVNDRILGKKDWPLPESSTEQSERDFFFGSR